MTHKLPTLNQQFQAALPSRDTPAEQWALADHAVFSGNFHHSVYHAVTASLIRTVGHEATYRVHEAMLRQHQEDHFLDGLTKLGLMEIDNDAQRCAMYHSQSNALGGLRTRWAVESPTKSWVFYDPQTCESPWPGQATAVHTREYTMSDYRGWHANNGALLGNDGLVFVATHFMCDGDPFDGGYFEDLGRPTSPEERARISAGELPPEDVEIHPLILDPQTWPADRLSKVFRTFAHGWAADRAVTSVQEFGDTGVDCVRAGLSITIHAWLPRLIAAYAGATTDPAQIIAKIIAGLQQSSGVGATVTQNSAGFTIDVDRALADHAAGSVSASVHEDVDRAVEAAWSSVAHHADRSLAVRRDARRWHVTRA